MHRWDVTPQEAVAIQRTLAEQVITQGRLDALRHVAGVDVGFEQRGAVTRAAVAVLRFPELELIEKSVVRAPTCFPYIPGLLSFREIPAVLSAIEQLTHPVDVYLCDGQGYAHPRRFGIACHLGVLLDKPAIGVAKTRLIGQCRGNLPAERGQWCELVHRDEVIGAVLTTRVGVKPLYVSIGHRVSLAEAVRVTMACTTRFRLPETTRWAHRLASAPDDGVAGPDFSPRSW